jgi:hypothetical protein
LHFNTNELLQSKFKAMTKKLLWMASIASLVLLGVSCKQKSAPTTETEPQKPSEMQLKVEEFVYYDLTSDLVKNLSENDKNLLKIFIKIGNIMDDLFWKQTFGDKSILDTIQDPYAKDFCMINYGPWERLDGDKPFVSGFKEKFAGCCYYPTDMTKEEFDKWENPDKLSLYTVIRRDENGKLKAVWYKDEYKTELTQVCALLDEAIAIADDPGMKKYLTERKKAFKTDQYYASDIAWMNMKNSLIDFVVGPIENYDDHLNEAKATYETFVLIKDEARSKELAKFVLFLPQLQKELPCEPQYKTFKPGTSSDLNVYDAVYYAGDCNSGSKTIAINLPNDEKVHAAKGTRRLQLRNAMQAKFEKILVPIADVIIEPAQRTNIKFDAFFWNVMFHEVSHGLGIKQTIVGNIPVDKALKTESTTWEEGKADIVGLFMTCKMVESGEIRNITVEDAMVTYIAGLLRSVRFGAGESHGKANIMCFNFMEKQGAFTRNEDGTYHIDFEKTRQAILDWSATILKMQGDGDYDAVVKYKNENCIINKALKKDLEKINGAGIPRDIRFHQGADVLGL